MKRKSNNDSGLTALAVSLLTAIAVSFVACNTIQLAPLDDAYYYPDKQEAPAPEPTQPSQPSQPSQPKPSSQVEYINIQDTTVTIRIKK